jgi:hypothetical protein
MEDEARRTSTETGRQQTVRDAARQVDRVSGNRRKVMLLSVVFLLVTLGLIALAAWFLSSNPARTANIRDILLVMMAFVLIITNIAIAGVLLVLVYRLQDLVQLLRSEIVPMLGNVSSTVRNVTGTARMVSDSVAKPTIKAASFIAGVQQAARVTRDKVSPRKSK